MEKDESKKERQQDLNATIKFLELTRKGKYAIIEENSLSYIRLSEETEVIDGLDEEYHYSLSQRFFSMKY